MSRRWSTGRSFLARRGSWCPPGVVDLGQAQQLARPRMAAAGLARPHPRPRPALAGPALDGPARPLARPHPLAAAGQAHPLVCPRSELAGPARPLARPCLLARRLLAARRLRATTLVGSNGMLQRLLFSVLIGGRQGHLNESKMTASK